MRTIIITGASGFLGRYLVEAASTLSPDIAVLPIYSPRQSGVDLQSPAAQEELARSISITNPQEAVLIHAAALIEWDTPAAMLANAAMAVHVSAWAKDIGIGFSVLVSSVSVYNSLMHDAPDVPHQPTTLYGLGKWSAEHIWRMAFAEKNNAIMRLAGLWGWQERPTLFWNRLLLDAGRGIVGEERPVVRRRNSWRNYMSVREASDCLLQVGANRMSGLFLGAGRDKLNAGDFIELVQGLHGSQLAVDWQDDGGEDEVIYKHSEALEPWLKPFAEELASCWADMPAWVRV